LEILLPEEARFNIANIASVVRQETTR